MTTSLFPTGSTAHPAAPVRLPSPADPAGFSDVLTAEWIKFFSVRSTKWSLLAIAVLGIGLTAVVCWASAAWLAGGDADEVPASFVIWGMMLAQIPAIVLGALVITSEYGTGMIRTTFAATPRRSRVVAAKATVLTGVLLAAGLAASFGSYLVGNLILANAGVGVSIGTDGLVRALFGNAVVLALLGLLAFAVGLLVRHTAAALAIVLGVVAVLASLAWALPGNWGAWIAKSLPGNSTQAITSVVPFNPDVLGAWTGLGMLAGQVALVVALGTYAVTKRDA